MSAPEPELVPLLLGHEQLAVRPSDAVGDQINLIAAAVCDALGDIYFAPSDWQEYSYPSAGSAGASEWFTHWGQGYFENDTFLLHGYTYDDSCLCGAWSNALDPAARQRVLAALEINDRARFSWRDDYEVTEARHFQLLAEADDRARRLTCACAEGLAEAVGGQAVAATPNFVFKPEGFAMNWYKHTHRGTSATSDPTPTELAAMTAACVASLGDSPPLVCATEQRQWPYNMARAEAHLDNVRALLACDQQRLCAALTEIARNY